MYIHSFDGQWLSHPFWRTRFIVTDQVDLLRVHASKVKAVVIDDAKGTGLKPVVRTSSMPTCVANDRVPDRILRSRAKTALQRAKGAVGERGALLRDPDASPSAVAERAEIVRILAESALEVRQAFDGLKRGHALPMAALASVVDDLSAAMAYNRTLMVGVSRLKTKDEYTFAHSVAVAALMLGFARELALDEAIVRDLALGGLVHDVGKMLIDDAILQKPGPLSNAEFAEMKRHPELGHRILSEDATISPIVLDVTLSHHERTGVERLPLRDPVARARFVRRGRLCPAGRRGRGGGIELLGQQLGRRMALAYNRNFGGRTGCGWAADGQNRLMEGHVHRRQMRDEHCQTNAAVGRGR